MNKLIITILGKDRPGIIAAVSQSLFNQDCNIENVNQMILQNEFAGFFIIEPPADKEIHGITRNLTKDLEGTGLHININPIDISSNGGDSPDRGEPFMVTTIGPDKKGLVAMVTDIFARHQVNVTNLQAVFKGGDDPKANIMCYEISITDQINQAQLFRELREKTREFDLDISIQHKNIFKTINKI